MKIIQTFWSGNTTNETPIEIKAGWLSAEYNWMSWALSCLLLRKYYDEVELYTDEPGKRILIDQLKLPYTNVHVVFDDSFQIHPALFSLAKIRTYSLQKKPFIHIDGDVFLWKRFPESLLKADLIASNLEIDLFFNKEILDEAAQKLDGIPEHLVGVHTHKNIFASNAGIIGGTNISFIKKYCNEAISFIAANKNNLELVHTKGLNFMIEQLSFYYLSLKENIPINYHVQEPVVHPLYQDFLRFSDVPNVDLVHPVGGCKKYPFILNHMANRLQLEFPSYYFKVLQLCKDANVKLHTSLYSYANFIEGIVTKNPSNFDFEIDPKIEELTKTNFSKSYKRTMDVIAHYYSKKITNMEELTQLVETKNVPPQLKEIYSLEKKSTDFFVALINDVLHHKIYNDEFSSYRKTSNFKMNEDWMNSRVLLPKSVQLLELRWNWKPLAEQTNSNDKAVYDKILHEEASSYYVTLNYNALHLGIYETHHDGIDAAVLQAIGTGRSIKEVLIEVSNCFEDGITIDNSNYQKLVFDVLKRLAFSGIISLDGATQPLP